MTSNDDSKIRWRCRRGMLELDQMLHTFFDKEYQKLSDGEKNTFSELLEHPDQEIYQWLLGMEQPSDSQLQPLLSKIQLAK